MKKIELKDLVGADLEFATQHNAMVDAIEAKNQTIQQLETKMAELEKVEVKNYDTQVLELKNAILTMEAELAKKALPASEKKSTEQILVDEIKSLGVNNMEELKAYLKKNGNQELEIKAITAIASTANTDTIGRTNLDNTVNWGAVEADAFLQNFRMVAEASNKSKFGYVEGSYTGNASYVGEGGSNANSDSASASATLANYAKIQSVLSVDTEVYEDIPDFAAGLISQMQIALKKFVDDEALSGDGLAPAGVQHIKGLLAYAIATEVALQGKGKYAVNVGFINPLDLYKLKREKATDGQPIVLLDSFGKPTIGGIRVIPTAKVTADTLLLMDSRIAEWRTKRSMTLKMGQILTDDVINDKQSAVLMARYQLLIRNADTKGIYKVASIAADLAEIAKAQA
jgi:hypothetical protein